MDNKSNTASKAKTAKVSKNRKPSKGRKTVKAEKTPKVAGGKINEGKCCRCAFRNKEKKCANKKSASSGTYTARKNGCEFFKYN